MGYRPWGRKESDTTEQLNNKHKYAYLPVHSSLILLFLAMLVIIFIMTFYCWPDILTPHSSTLVWKIPWMEEPGRLQSMGSLRERLHFHFSLSCIGKGNGNPL